MKKDENKLRDQGVALVSQRHQLDNAQHHLGLLDDAVKKMIVEQDANEEILENLLAEAELNLSSQSVSFEVEDENDELLYEQELLVGVNAVSAEKERFGLLDHISVCDSEDWFEYVNKLESYASRQKLDFRGDPFKQLMTVSQRVMIEKRVQEEFTLKKACCDKYDYMIAGTCGLIGGLIDMVFIGLPGEGKLTSVADDFVDRSVERFASVNGWPGAREGKNSTASAIGYLEEKYGVNYDQVRSGGKNGTDGLVSNMYPKNHHIKSLSHSPDLIGLFFSIIDQFNNTSHFVSNGQLVSVDTTGNKHTLKGSNFVAKIFAGFCNWLGHLFSDVAGASGSRGNPLSRGSGIPIPFFSLLQFVNVGEFGKNKQSFATIAVKVFEKGYDFRHGVAMAIPVLITELLARISWVFKRRIYHDEPWESCLPSANNPELRRMLLIAHGSLCMIDTADAAIRSGGEIVQFLLRSNLIAWARFGTLALKEVKASYVSGSLDIEAVDDYLDNEYVRLLG